MWISYGVASQNSFAENYTFLRKCFSNTVFRISQLLVVGCLYISQVTSKPNTYWRLRLAGNPNSVLVAEKLFHHVDFLIGINQASLEDEHLVHEDCHLLEEDQ